jgi:hypothetical protein
LVTSQIRWLARNFRSPALGADLHARTLAPIKSVRRPIDMLLLFIQPSFRLAGVNAEVPRTTHLSEKTAVEPFPAKDGFNRDRSSKTLESTDGKAFNVTH